jgi:hypothetical protein
MARLILCYRVDYQKTAPVETYARSFHHYAEKLGHEVLPVGEGHANRSMETLSEYLQNQYDLFIDLDCGRNAEGKLHLQNQHGIVKIPSAVWFIDSHGYPTLHKRTASHYKHVFFAVWDKRDLFVNHPSAHWLPNASDLRWFNYTSHLPVYNSPGFDIGFFSSKGGLERADDLKSVCAVNGWNYDIREVGKQYKNNRWPRTAEAMANCNILFNRGQKHDGPNQRVIESMLLCRPLVTDKDNRDGMKHLFKEGEHYLPYATPGELAERIRWCLAEPEVAHKIAVAAYAEARANHTVLNRVQNVLEVCLQ